MSGKKYELTEETKTLLGGIVLHRIFAVKDFTTTYGVKISAGEFGGWIEDERNLSQEGVAWIDDEACVYDKAIVSGNVEIGGHAVIKDNSDYSVYKNTWSSMRWVTHTRSDRMWKAGCFRGTGEELIAKAYKDNELSGRCYEAIVRAQEAIDIAINRATGEKYETIIKNTKEAK